MTSLDFKTAIKKHPALSVCIAVLVIVLVGLYYRYDLLTVNEAKLNDLKSNLAKLQKNIASSSQLDRQLAEIKVINEKIAVEVLRPTELARNLQFFYALEAANDVKLLDLQQQAVPAPAKGVQSSLYTPLTFSINISGDYANVLRFVRSVEKTFVGGRVLSATISPGSASAGQDASKARLVSMIVQTVAINKS